MDGIAKRLQREIDRLKPEGKRRGIGLFKWKMEMLSRARVAAGEKPIPGISYPSIRSYLDGETVPSLEFLYAAAEVFGVRPAYLIMGEGPRTEREVEGAAPSILDEAFSEYPELADLVKYEPVVEAALADLALRAVELASAANLPDGAVRAEEVAKRIAGLMLAPIDWWVEWIGDFNVNSRLFGVYAVSAIQSVAFAFDAVVQQGILDRLLREDGTISQEVDHAEA